MHKSTVFAKNIDMLRYVIVAFAVIFLVFPIFSDVLILWNRQHDKLYFYLRLFRCIKIYGGYAQLCKDAVAFHVSRKKAYLLPYAEAMGTTGKKLQITKGFRLTSLSVISEIGYGDNPPITLLATAVLQTVFSFGYAVSLQNNFHFHANTVLSAGDRLHVFIRCNFIFNVLILLLAGIKILIKKGIEYGKRKQT